MIKSIFKYGNVIETRMGKKYLYTEDKNHNAIIVNLDDTEFDLDPDQYHNDLTYNHDSRTRHYLDIMKVYQDYTCKKLLWERKEKPHLTDDEKVILRNLDKKYKYISRNSDGYLFVTTTAGIITAGSNVNLIVFNHLFRATHVFTWSRISMN